MDFPYGKAPFVLLVMAVGSSIALMASTGGDTREPDLTFVVFADSHLRAYQAIIPEFERQHGVHIRIQQVQIQCLQSRLSAALLSGAEVPDVVELVTGSMGFFTKGPVEDVGFLDLTERIQAEGLDERLVSSRFSLWSSRGHIFGLPHDVHPVVLAYNRDVVAELGIDVDAIETWDDFVRVGREITKDLNGDGVIDRFAIDMFADGGDHLEMLIRQRGANLFDADGRLTMYDPRIVDTIIWYVHQTRGPDRIAFPCGWGQPLSKAMLENFVIFYFAPDWRTKNFELETPKMAGRLGLMPLPAWEPGGRRTSTWGGTGLCITKACENPELAWEFAKFLYLNREMLGQNFDKLNILPPLKDAWDLPALNEPDPFYRDQVIGSLFAELAPETPPVYVTPYSSDALWKLNEVFIHACAHYDQHGDDGLRAFVDKDLSRASDAVQRLIDFNSFYGKVADAR